MDWERPFPVFQGARQNRLLAVTRFDDTGKILEPLQR